MAYALVPQLNSNTFEYLRLYHCQVSSSLRIGIKRMPALEHHCTARRHTTGQRLHYETVAGKSFFSRKTCLIHASQLSWPKNISKKNAFHFSGAVITHTSTAVSQLPFANQSLQHLRFDWWITCGYSSQKKVRWEEKNIHKH